MSEPPVRAGIGAQSDAGILTWEDEMRFLTLFLVLAGVFLVFVGVFLLSETASALEGTAVHCVVLMDETGTMRFHGRASASVDATQDVIGELEPGDWLSVYGYGEGARALAGVCPVQILGSDSRERAASGTSFFFDDDRTDITAAFELVWSDLESARQSGEPWSELNTVILLVTDGKLIPVYDDYSKYDSVYRRSKRTLLELASSLGKKGIPVYAIGIGSSESLDEELLSSIASRAGGVFVEVGRASELRDACADIVVSAERLLASDAPGSTRASAHGARAKPEAEHDGSGGISWTEAAEASERTSGALLEPEARETACDESRPISLIGCLPPGMFERYAAALAVVVGIVAVGIQRKRAWASVFTREMFGGGQVRVRGYLVPVDPDGITTARPNIGLENPGVESLKIGTGTPYAAYVTDTVIEFFGTRDGTPPILNVERGDVRVDGKVIQTAKLDDGDLLEIEGFVYRYLRGNRK